MTKFSLKFLAGSLAAGAFLSGCASLSSTSNARLAAHRGISSQAESKIWGDAWEVVSPAELANYTQIWGLSDLHGRLDAFENLLGSAKLISDNSGTGHWVANKQLLVITGDYIDGGDDSAQILLRVKALMGEAKKKGSRIIPLLGNHEARFLSDPRPKNLETATLASFARALSLTSDQLNGDTLERSELGKFMKQMKVGAVVGDWLFAHSGSLRTKVSEAPDFIRAIGAAWSLQSREGFAQLSDEDGKGIASVLARHDWWDSEHADLREVLDSLGIVGLVVGHEPGLMGGGKLREQVVMSEKGWAIKIDTALKDGPKMPGEMLHCPRAPDGTFRMEAGNHSVCLRHLANGSESPLDRDP